MATAVVVVVSDVVEVRFRWDERAASEAASVAAIESDVVTASSVSLGVDERPASSVPPFSRLLDTGEEEGMTSGPSTWRARMAVMSSWNEDSCSSILPQVNRPSLTPATAAASELLLLLLLLLLYVEVVVISRRD